MKIISIKIERPSWRDLWNASVIGLASMRIWSFLLLFNKPIFVHASLEDLQSPAYMTSIAALGLLACAIGIAPRLYNIAMGNRIKYVILGCMILSPGVVLCPWLPPIIRLVLFGLFSGLGIMLFVGWGVRFAACSFSKALVQTASAYLLSSIILLACTPAPLIVQITVFTGACIISMILLDHVTPVTVAETSASSFAIPLPRKLLSQLLVTIFVIGIVGTMFRELSTGSYVTSYSFELRMASVIASALIGFSAYAIAAIVRGRSGFLLIWRLFIFSFITALVLHVVSPNTIVSTLARETSLVFFDFVVWLIVICASSELPASGVRIAALGRFAYIGGLSIGIVVTLSPILWTNIPASLLLMVPAVIFCSLFVCTERAIIHLFDGLRIQGTSTASRDMATRLSNEHNLSDREQQILQLRLMGRSNKRIAEELGLAPGTINTYQSRIYHKLGIHSHQELLDMAYRENPV